MATFFLLPTTTITLILFLLSTSPSVTSGRLVLDVEGIPVDNGGSYYIYRDMAAPDEGPITWTSTKESDPCPLFVTKGHQDISPLSSVTIALASLILFPYITLDSPILLSFNDKSTPCKSPLSWSVKPDGSIDASYVVAGDKVQPYSKGTFILVEAEETTGNPYAYKLQFCVNWEKLCLDVGMIPSNNLFAITPNAELNLQPLYITFVKASSPLKKNIALQ